MESNKKIKRKTQNSFSQKPNKELRIRRRKIYIQKVVKSKWAVNDWIDLQRKNLSTCPGWVWRSCEDYQCSWSLLRLVFERLLVVGQWWTKVSHWPGLRGSGMCEWSGEMGLGWRRRDMWRRVELYGSLVAWEWEGVKVSSNKWKPLKFRGGVD